MSRSRSAPPRSATAKAFLAFGCLVDLRARQRLDSALRGYGSITWFPNFRELRAGLETDVLGVRVVVVDMEDSFRASAAALAREIAESRPGVGVVVHQRS